MYGHGLGTGYLGRRGYRKITSEEAILEAVNLPELYNATGSYIVDVVLPLVSGSGNEIDEEQREQARKVVSDPGYLRMAIESAIMIAGIAHVTYALPSPFKGYIVENTGKELAEKVFGRRHGSRDGEAGAEIALLMAALHAFLNKVLIDAWRVDEKQLTRISTLDEEYWDRCMKEFNVGDGVIEQYLDDIRNPALRCNIAYTVKSIMEKSREKNVLRIHSIHYPAGIYIPIYHVLGHIALVFLARAFAARCMHENPYCISISGTTRTPSRVLSVIKHHVLGGDGDIDEESVLYGIAIPLGIAAMILLGPYYTSGLVKLASLIEFFNPIINANTIDSISRSIIMSGAVTGLSYNYRDLVTIPDITMASGDEISKLDSNTANAIEKFVEQGHGKGKANADLVARSLREPFIIHRTRSGGRETYFLLPYVVEARDAIKLVELYTSMLFYDRLVARHNITVQITHEYYTTVFPERGTMAGHGGGRSVYAEMIRRLSDTIIGVISGGHGSASLLKDLHTSFDRYVEEHIQRMNRIGLSEKIVRKLLEIRKRTKLVYEYTLCGIKSKLLAEMNIMLDSLSAVNPEQIHDQMKLSEIISEKFAELLRKNGEAAGELGRIVDKIDPRRLLKVALIPHEGDLVRPAEFKSMFLVKHVIGENEYSIYSLDTMLSMLQREKGISLYLIVYVIIPGRGGEAEEMAELLLSKRDVIDVFLRKALGEYIELCTGVEEAG